MDGGRFDQLAQTLGHAVDRRAGRRGLLALAAALVTAALGTADDLGANRRQQRRSRRADRDVVAQGPCGDGRGKANRCKRHGQCCTRYCRKGRCRCKRSGQACTDDRNCCLEQEVLTCQDGTCQPAQSCAATCAGCCADGACAPGSDDTACGSGGAPCMRCTAPETCVDNACTTVDPVCPTCQIRNGSQCQPAPDETACDIDRICCGGSCVNPQTDIFNCGGCEILCLPNYLCRSGGCVCLPPNSICGSVCQFPCSTNIPLHRADFQTCLDNGQSCAVCTERLGCQGPLDTETACGTVIAVCSS